MARRNAPGQPSSLARMDAPLRAAVLRAGGRRPFFRALGYASAPRGWQRCPRARLFEVSDLCDMPPEALRPDLAGWIAEERERRVRQAESFGRIGAAVEARGGGEMPAGLLDLWSTITAIQFVAQTNGLRVRQVCVGVTRQEQAARAYAMALAKVVGRASSSNVAGVFGCARQNVDNAAERYLRARDGDDPDDYIRGFESGPRVWEASRLRRPKAASEELWAAERDYAALLTGETFNPRDERKRA